MPTPGGPWVQYIRTWPEGAQSVLKCSLSLLLLTPFSLVKLFSVVVMGIFDGLLK